MLDETIAKLRDDTPGASGHIHLNNAGASLMPEPVVSAIMGHLELERDLGGYEAAAHNAEAAQRLYGSLASLLRCEADEIGFADSGSRAWNAILYAIELSEDDVVLTSQAEFGSNVVSLVQHCQRTGAELRVVQCTTDGALDLDDLERKFDEHVKLVAVTHLCAHRGYRAPVAEIAKRASAAGAFFLLDSAQAVGQQDLNVSDLGCHALIGTGRKWLRGPRGTAFAYVSRDLPFPVSPAFCDLASADFIGGLQGPFELQIREDARRFELWERNIAAAIGLGVAVDYLLEAGPVETYARIAELGRYTANALEAATEDVTVLADPDQPSGIVGLAFHDDDRATAVKKRLADSRISASTMADYDAPWDYAALGVSTILRVASHYFNTEQEIDAFVEVIG